VGSKMQQNIHFQPHLRRTSGIYVFSEPLIHLLKIVLYQNNFTWEEAKQSCEKIGFKLLSLESAEKFGCLNDIFLRKPHLARSHWTSGVYFDCQEQRKFSWCGVGEDLDESKVTWGANQPPANKAGTCLSLVLAPGKMPHIQAQDCNNKLSYICEVSIFYSSAQNVEIILF